MTELPPETLAGVMQNVAAPRLQPSAAKGAQADIAFARALDFLRGRKEENRKEPGEQPPPGTALPQQAAPGPSSQLAMDKLIAAASKEDQPGDEPKADAKAECQAQNVLTTPPLFPLAICAPAFRESKSHCGGDPSTAPAKIDLQAGMIAASVSSPGRPDLKGQAIEKTTAERTGKRTCAQVMTRSFWRRRIAMSELPETFRSSRRRFAPQNPGRRSRLPSSQPRRSKSMSARSRRTCLLLSRTHCPTGRMKWSSPKP